jgi:Predicted membrane protein
MTTASMSMPETKIINRNLWSGALFGLGMVAFIDETVFHQLLHWHHFYDRSTTGIGLVSDGLFHAFSWIATIGGLFLLADLRRKNALSIRRWWGASQLAGGIFQLYDGIIQHKWMRLHQIRYVDHVFIYDLIWNLLACFMIIMGLFQINKARNSPSGKTS